MVGILALLGLGLLIGGIAVLSDDDDNSSSEEGVEPTSIRGEEDEPLLFIGEEYFDEFEAALDALVDEEEFTQAEADALLAETETAAGPLDIVSGNESDGILGGSDDDSIESGAGEDLVYGGEGDDTILLGDGADVSGASDRTGTFPDDLRPFEVEDAGLSTPAVLEAGNDTIRGGDGADDIADGYGSNELRGERGNDFIVAVDRDGLTPDLVRGGVGSDALVVDEGDTVDTGVGQDFVTVDLTNGVDDAYQLVTIQDFDPSLDSLELEGADSLVGGAGAVTLEAVDGATLVLVNDIAVVRLEGVEGLSVSDLLLSTV